MNLSALYENNGVFEIPNPKYKDTKTNKEPATIATTDFRDTAVGKIVDDVYKGNLALDDVYDAKEMEKYREYGVMVNKWRRNNIDKELAEAQSNWSKAWHSITQTLISEVGLGTIKGISDLGSSALEQGGRLLDTIFGTALAPKDKDFNNPVSAKLEEWQETFRNYQPIHVDPTIQDSSSRFANFGWWASNFPSVASSLTLLIPSTAVAKGLGVLGKVSKLGKFTRNAVKAVSGANKATKAEDVAKLNTFAKWANKRGTIDSANRMLEYSANAIVSRTLENYQEGRQVYNDMYKDVKDSFSTMTNQEYQAVVEANKELIARHNINPNNKDALAKAIAEESADLTFRWDYLNTGFDIIQLYGLRNIPKLVRNMRAGSSVRAAERKAKKAAADYVREKATRVAGKTAEKVEEEATKGLKTALDKGSNVISNIGYKTADLFRWGKTSLLAEWSEGIEEAVNYIAQQEGMHYGNVMLGKEKPSAFDTRFKQYMAAPELWDSAFWGLVGGVVFNAAGSGVNRISNAIQAKYNEHENQPDKKTGEKLNKSWTYDFETSENKRRISEVDGRIGIIRALGDRVARINQGYNPYIKNPDDPTTDKKIESDVEREIAIQKAQEDAITNLTLHAMDVGNYNQLKAYFQDNDVKEALIAAGIVEKEGIDEFVKSVSDRMDDIANRYDNNLLALENMTAVIANDKRLKGMIPLEYLQMIARENVFAELTIDNLDNQIAAYEADAAKKEQEFGKYGKLDPSLNYRTSGAFVALTKILGELKANRRNLIEDKKQMATVQGQIELDNYNIRIRTIEDQIYRLGTQQEEDPGLQGIARLLYATGLSSRTVAKQDKAGNISYSFENTKDYVTFLDNLTKKEVSSIVGKDKKFEASDENILRLFGENNTTGLYGTLKSDIDRAYATEQSINKISPDLDTDYQIIAVLNLQKALAQQERTVTADELVNAINTKHLVLQEARAKAVDSAIDTLYELSDKYGTDAIINLINNENTEIQKGVSSSTKSPLEESEHRMFKDAIDVLNLTQVQNSNLADVAIRTLRARDIAKAANVYNEEKSSIVNENPQETSETAASENSSETDQQSSSEPETSQNQGQTLQTAIQQPQITKPQQKQPYKVLRDDINVTVDVVGGISIEEGHNGTSAVNQITADEVAVSDDEQGYKLRIDKLNAKDKSYWIDNEELFENVGEENVEVETNPILVVTDGGVTVIKGRLTKASNKKISSLEERQREELEDRDKVLEIRHNRETFVHNELVSISKKKFGEVGRRLTYKEVDDLYTEAKEDLIKELVSEGAERKEAEEIVTIQISIFLDLKRRADSKSNSKEAKDILNSVEEVIRASSVGEITDELVQSVRNLIEEFAKISKTNNINGKRYISVESLFRYLNQLVENKGLTSVMIDITKDVISDPFMFYNLDEDGQNIAPLKDIVIVDDIRDPNLLANLNKSVEDRLAEKIKSTLRVDIGAYIEAFASDPDTRPEEYNKTLNEVLKLKKGNVITTEIDKNGDILLYHDDVSVGRLPKPGIDRKTGHFVVVNDGWITDLDYKGISPLKDFFLNVANEENEEYKELRDLLYRLAFEPELQKNENKRNEVVSKVVDILRNNSTANRLIAENASNKEIVEGMVKVFKYGMCIDTIQKGTLILTPYSGVQTAIEAWFDKLLNSYTTISGLSNSNAKMNITVSRIRDGKIIEVATAAKYKDCNPISTAISTTYGSDQLPFVATVHNHSIVLPSGRVITNMSGEGQVFTVIPNRDGVSAGLVKTFAGKFEDTTLRKGVLGKIDNAIIKEFDSLLREFAEAKRTKGDYKEAFQNIANFLSKVFPCSSSFGSTLTRNETIIPISFGESSVILNYSNRTLVKTTIIFKNNGQQNKVILNLQGIDDHKEIELQITKDKELKKSQYNTSDNDVIKEVVSLFKKAFHKNSLNVSRKLLASDKNPTTSNVKGFITRNSSTGDLEIKIGDYSETFDSYNDFLIKGNCLRCNTEVRNGTNFEPRPIHDQISNMVFEVNIEGQQVEDVTQKRLEELDEEKKTEVERIKLDTETDSAILAIDILNNNKKQHKGNAILEVLAERIFPNDKTLKKKINKLKRLKLLPKKIIFAEKLEKGLEAETIIEDEVVRISDKWLELYNENPSRALRVLIHEKLHLVFGKEKEEEKKKILNKVKVVLEAFKEANKQLEDNIYEPFEFNNFEEEEALEEFLVESLTNEVLIKRLNEIEATEDIKGKKRQSLWSKLLEALLDIFKNVFNIDIKKGSLLEQEIKLLKDDINDIASAIKTIKEKETKATKRKQYKKSKRIKKGTNEDTKNPLEVTEKPAETIEQTQSAEEQEQPLEDLDILFGIDASDIKGSSIGEDGLIGNIETIIKKLDSKINIEAIHAINKGEIKITCK